MDIASVSLHDVADARAEALLTPSDIFHYTLEMTLGPLGRLDFKLQLKGLGNQEVPIAGY